jgi:hypothetical protein
VERRIAAVTPRATPIAGRAAISPSPPIISTRIGTTPIQMARPAGSPVSVGTAPVSDLNDHRRRIGERLNRHGPKLRECRRRNRGAEEKRECFQQSGLLLPRAIWITIGLAAVRQRWASIGAKGAGETL